MGSVKLAALFLVVFCVSLQNAADLQMGTSLNGQLVYVENVNLSAIPFTTRVKNVFYNGNSTSVIRGLWALDRDQTRANVIVTAGGVGSTFVNMRLKSERGDGLRYQVQVFV